MQTAVGSGGFGQAGHDEVRRNWGWFLAMGVLLIILGVVALSCSVLTTIASVVLFGWMLIISGAVQAVHALWRERNWRGFFLDLFAGILSLVVGLMLVANPLAGAKTLTLVVAMFLLVGGFERIVASLTGHFPNRLWLLVNGIVNVGLGIFIWREWPISGLWVIGLYVGVDMLLSGWAAVMLAFAAKSYAGQATSGTANEESKRAGLQLP